MEWTTPQHLEPTPHMGPAHWDMICAEAEHAFTLEFGSGGATCWVAQNLGVGWWVAVEHQQEWYRAVWRFLTADSNNAIDLLLATSEEFYVSPPVDPAKFDVIIVDGKHRNSVLANLQDYLAPGGKVFLHDAERKYQIPDFLKEVHRSTDPTWTVNPNTELAVYEMR